MEQFTLQDVANWTKGKLSGDGALELRSVSTDSRNIGESGLFIPLAGDRFDGHDFLPQAMEQGAAAVLSHRQEEQYGVPTVYVEDTRQALLDLAGGYRAARQARVIGITGSVGKTTTKEMMASTLARQFQTLKTEQNLNNEIGMPLTLLRIADSDEIAVLEMGMNHFGELSRMTASAKPDVAVITNIGTSHIEHLGSREGICHAKLEILEGLQPDGVAVLCGDEPLLWAKRGKLPCRTIYYGIDNPECDITGGDIVNEGSLVRFYVRNRTLESSQLPRGKSFRAHLCVAGRHNVLNALAAAAVALYYKEEPGAIVAGLEEYHPTGMRQNTYERNGYTIFADCYNASPDAMEAALSALSEIPTEGRRVAALGGMLELGSYHAEGHRRAGKAAAQHADLLYLYGDGSEDMKQGAIENGMDEACITIFDSHEKLADALRQEVKAGDTVLFKGSRGMHMERALQLFDEETEV